MILLRIFSLATVAAVLFNCTSTKKISKISINPAYEGKYRNKLDSGSTLIGAGYHFTIEKLGDTAFLYKQYDPQSGRLIALSHYRDPYLQTHQGRFVLWLDDGGKYVEGQYQNGLKTGIWKEYHLESGKLYRKAAYKRGERKGKWVVLDSTGKVEKEMVYGTDGHKGLPDLYADRDDIFGENIYPHIQMFYAPGLPVDATAGGAFDTLPYLLSCGKDSNRLECSERTIARFLRDSLRYPPSARKNQVQGTALARFEVNESGEVVGVKILRRVSEAIGEECNRLIKSLPAWQPAQIDGKPARHAFYLPVDFGLEENRK